MTYTLITFEKRDGRRLFVRSEYPTLWNALQIACVHLQEVAWQEGYRKAGANKARIVVGSHTLLYDREIRDINDHCPRLDPYDAPEYFQAKAASYYSAQELHALIALCKAFDCCLTLVQGGVKIERKNQQSTPYVESQVMSLWEGWRITNSLL